MKISSIFYSIKQGIVNIKRNKMFSLASVGTIAACIFLIGLFYSVLMNFQHMIKNAEDAVGITVFFNNETTEERINEIKDEIGKRVEVAHVDYTSADEAWENYKKVYFGDMQELADGFKDDNPLANSASLTITLNDLDMQDTLVSYIKTIDGVRKVNYSDETASTVSDFGKLVAWVSAAIIIVLLAVGIFLISNTVMIGITVRKEEIGIMKLMGARDSFVRAPFIVEGVMIGLVGAAIPLVILYFIYRNVVLYILEQFQSLDQVMSFLTVSQIFKILTPMSLIIGAGIGLIGSMITIRKHLRV